MPTTEENFVLLLKLAKAVLTLREEVAFLAHTTNVYGAPEFQKALDKSNKAIDKVIAQMEKM